MFSFREKSVKRSSMLRKSTNELRAQRWIGMTYEFERWLESAALLLIRSPKSRQFLWTNIKTFSVSALKLIMEIAKPSGHNVFFCGDERQRIYWSNWSFRQLGIEVRGRALTLATNYRNSRQIAEVAAHLTRAIEGDDLREPCPLSRLGIPRLRDHVRY